jgi:hypothetical protein
MHHDNQGGGLSSTSRLLQIPATFITLREGHKLRVFENRALRRILGPNKMD